MSFQKLVRFESNGLAYYGDLISVEANGYKVRRLNGNLENFQATSDDTIIVPKLLCPLEQTPIIICIGLNYKKHAEEASLKIPPYPVVFTKPADALAGSNETIPVFPGAQSMLDYEGELTFIIKKDCKNLPLDFKLSEYILGYTAGNDLSARNFQLPEASGGQFCYAKSFDGFAPIGPWIVSSEVIPDPQQLDYVTRVNGVVKQSTSTSDMIWTVQQILHHITQGTTVRAGTVVMTGTPSGVGFFRKEFLKDGDKVEVEIEAFVKLENTLKFERATRA
ncbi:hypothetical protein F5884DRAFT_900099 [Xylogone sp. PMI_703]|nr:hypothetical protein F5884DRAFT_900099 [Xylogone sp. PMI_703]